MIRPGISFSKMRETRTSEWLSRFAFGGAVTVAASLIADRWGPVVGGLFLAFPGIFPPSLSLTEEHAERRKAKTGKRGVFFGRAEASVEAAGASAGALGLAAFALVLWKGLEHCNVPLLVLMATGAWGILSMAVWALREAL